MASISRIHNEKADSGESYCKKKFTQCEE